MLWVNLFSFKYLYGISILEASDYQSFSCIWKTITKTVEVLKSYLMTIIGRWEVSLWCDKWLEDNYLSNHVPCIHVSETNLRLKDIYHPSHWNFSISQLRSLSIFNFKFKVSSFMSLPTTSKFELILHQVFALLKVVDFNLSFFCMSDSTGNMSMDLEARPPREKIYIVCHFSRPSYCVWCGSREHYSWIRFYGGFWSNHVGCRTSSSSCSFD